MCRNHLRHLLLGIVGLQVVVFFIYIKPAHVRVGHVTKHMVGDTLDHSGDYRIVRFYRTSGFDNTYSFHDISLATQCSVNHLHHLVELLDRWDGPVSCSVFAPNQDASYADDAIKLMRRCFPLIKRHVTFHLVYPSAHLADLGKIGSWLSLTCQELLYKLENYGYQNYDVAGMSFPHNVLRNAARSGVMTQYVLLVDIDVMPNVGLRKQFLDFAERKAMFDVNASNQVAYVLPVFEVLEGLPFPKEKRQLLEGVLNGTIRPFHNETCWWCHKSEDFGHWRNIPQTERLEIAFHADWDKSWEPFYIAHRNVPMFDERFKQYGFDRIQQICEMHVAGYEFAILNNAFLTHHGWKMAGKFYARKDSDNAQNWILFNYHFKDELPKKYETNRSCSPIEFWNPKEMRGALVGGRGLAKSRLNGKAVIGGKSRLSWET